MSDALVTIRYRIKNMGSSEEYKEDGLTFDFITRDLIKEEGIIGVAEDEYEILSVEEVEER